MFHGAFGIPALKYLFTTVNAHIYLVTVLIMTKKEDSLNALPEIMTIFTPRFTDVNDDVNVDGDNPSFYRVTGVSHKYALVRSNSDSDFASYLSEVVFITTVTPFNTCLKSPYICNFGKDSDLDIERKLCSSTFDDDVLANILFPTSPPDTDDTDLCLPWCSILQKHTTLSSNMPSWYALSLSFLPIPKGVPIVPFRIPFSNDVRSYEEFL